MVAALAVRLFGLVSRGFAGQLRASAQSPDHGTGDDLDGSSVDALSRRSWDAPVGVWGGKTHEELYVEHALAARRLALSMVPPDVADDVVAEAFAKVLAVIARRRAESRVPGLPAYRGASPGHRLAAEQMPPDGRRRHGRRGR